MRITNSMILGNTKGNINSNKLLVDKYNTQMTTQKKISKASENPVIAIRSLRLSTTMSQITQYTDNNIPDAIAWMDITENALTNMKDLLTDIRTRCVNGSSDSLNSEDRQTILEALKALSEQVYSEGNADYAGKSVFTGYRTSDTLTFQNDEPETKFEIEQTFKFDELEEKRYYTGEVQIPEAITENTTACDTKVKENTYERVRLAYNGEVDIQSFDISYVDKDGNKQNVDYTLKTYETEAEWEAAKQAREVADDEVVFIENTGDIIVGKQVADDISDNYASIDVTYTKKGFDKGEAKPYYYYDCRDVSDDDVSKHVSYTKEDQSINYATATSAFTTINTQAENVFGTEILRDVEELINVAQRSINADDKVKKLENMLNEAQYQDEKSQELIKGYLEAAKKEADYADDNFQKTFESYIGRFNGYMEKVNTAIIDVGSKCNSLALIQTRVESQRTTIEELKSENEDREISDVIIDYYAAYNAYTSSLTAAGKLNENNLLQYI